MMQMNRINQFLYFAILILLVSCSENNPVQQEEPDVVSEIISELNFATGTSNQTISFTTNKKWEASLSSPQGDVSWCTLSPTNGNAGSVTINISVTENNGYDDRKALMTIITGNTEKNINIIQRQKDVIIVSKSNFEVSEEGGTIEVETNTNLDLEVIIPKEADWIHLVNTSTKALTSNKYIFNIDENIKATERQIIITFKDKKSNLSQYIEVKQHGRTKQTIHVEIPGTLSDFLQSGSSEIDSLIITGKIHGTDIGTIGGMANLTYLDLTNCDIVDGGEYRRGEYPYTTYSTKAGILPSFMFPERHPIQEILIPNSTIVIGAFALSGCENITSISIPVGVKTIDMCAFSGCKIKFISIPNTVREIKSQLSFHVRV